LEDVCFSEVGFSVSIAGDVVDRDIIFLSTFGEEWKLCFLSDDEASAFSFFAAILDCVGTEGLAPGLDSANGTLYQIYRDRFSFKIPHNTH
jgi:hypothetical protein